MLIRAGRAGDLAEILKLERATANAPHWAEPEYRLALDSSGSDVSSSVKRCLLVAEIAGQVDGFAIGKVTNAGDAMLAELESVAVASRARRQGIGRALCIAVKDWCRKQSAVGMELEVRAGSEGAIAFYESLGFQVAGRRKGYYRDPADDALLMRMELSD